MCGIAGLIAKNNLSESDINSFLDSSKLMKHRGPDYNDFIKHENCLLIHYRLSIIDLDSRSNQPFISSNGDYICSYNGEIYNYSEIKRSKGIQTRTTSDTEVMIESFSIDEERAIPEWNGIFALAILKKSENKLFLIRDRFGVKPLYYFEDNNYFAFASEAKVLYQWLDKFELNPQGVSEYLWYGNTISENTIVKGVNKFEPGTVLTYDIGKMKVEKERKYWKLPSFENQSFTGTDPVTDIRDLLEGAVRRQLVSDVPLGVLLSGGIDSSALVAFGSRYIDKLDTYTVEYDFNLGGKSELENALSIAKKFDTNHHEMKVRSEDITDIFSDLVFQYDEPFADTANIPLYLLARECSKDKTVILQGDGGDEIFGGYRRYNVLDWFQLWKVFSSLSHRFIPSKYWANRMKRVSYILKQRDDAMKMALYITEDVPYNPPTNILNRHYRKRLEEYDPFISYKQFNSDYSGLELVQRMLYADVHILLNHTYLEKVDKATMLCSLESRVPFLDNHLAQYILNLPSSSKVRYGQKKYLLRKSLRGIVPDQILDGKKRGFEVPYKTWLKDGLFDFAMATFEEVKEKELMDKNHLLELMSKHKKGEGNFGPLLWKALVLAHWLKIYRNKIV